MSPSPFPLCLLLVVTLATPISPQQGSHAGTPGKAEVAAHPLVLDAPTGPAPGTIDPVKIHTEADELAKLAATVPGDIDQVAQGKLPKDIGDKLKRIEKLSKNIRGELAP